VSAPSLIHFYSYVTGVSLELPVGFEFAGEDDTSATYADLDEIGAATAQVRVQVVGALDGPDAGRSAVDALADGFASLDGEVLSRTARTVDERPTSTVVLRQAGDGGLLHLTAAASEHRLLSLVAIAPSEQLLTAYDAAVESIRFIEL
jgi:hypothetical protein